MARHLLLRRLGALHPSGRRIHPPAGRQHLCPRGLCHGRLVHLRRRHPQLRAGFRLLDGRRQCAPVCALGALQLPHPLPARHRRLPRFHGRSGRHLRRSHAPYPQRLRACRLQLPAVAHGRRHYRGRRGHHRLHLFPGWRSRLRPHEHRRRHHHAHRRMGAQAQRRHVHGRRPGRRAGRHQPAAGRHGRLCLHRRARRPGHQRALGAARLGLRHHAGLRRCHHGLHGRSLHHPDPRIDGLHREMGHPQDRHLRGGRARRVHRKRLGHDPLR